MDCAFPETRNLTEQRLILAGTIESRWPLPWPLCELRAKRSSTAPKLPAFLSRNFLKCWNQWWNDSSSYHRGHRGTLRKISDLWLLFLISSGSISVNQRKSVAKLLVFNYQITNPGSPARA